MKDLVHEVKQSQKKGESPWLKSKSYEVAEYIYYWVQSKIGWCSKNPVKCLAVLFLIAAITLFLFFPGWVLASVSAVLSQLVNSFFARIFGTIYRITQVSRSRSREDR